MTPTRRLLGAALLAGLIVRLLFALGYWQDKPLTHDEEEYLALAMNLASGRGFARELPGLPTGPAVEVFSRAPLYPALLAGVFRLTGEPTDRLPSSVPRTVQIVQAFWGVATVWLVGCMAARAAGERAGAIAAWTAALYPPLVWSSAYALSEVVYSPLVLGSAWVVGRVTDHGDRSDRHDTRSLFTAGVLAGLAALVRSVALIFIALACGWLLWRRRPGLAAVALAGALVVVAPWTIRNLITHGRLIVVAADGGVTFWTGNHPLAIGEGDMAANPAIKAAHAAFKEPLSHLTPEQREPYYYRAAISWIAEHPASAITLMMKKFFYTWVPIGPSYTLHSARYYWATVAAYVPLLLLACLGVPALAKSTSPPVALTLLCASSVLVSLVFFPQDRFRIPVIDPALCVGAAAWLVPRMYP
jgi:4-amino-4-deoxy-L-arabinose transferase-like glycosyltransferase